MDASASLPPDLLGQLILEIDRRAKEETATQRVVLLGIGAMVDWNLGRRQFKRLKEAIEKAVPQRLGNGWVIECHWLGYPQMDAPFDAGATLSSIELSASGIQHAIDYFPRSSIFDFVCHSLSGLITLYWSLRFASTDDLKRINSITTINSPLVGHNRFAEVCQDHLDKYKTLLGQPYIPIAATDLREKSPITGPVSEWNLPIHLLNVGTRGDGVVPVERATIPGASEPPLIFDGNRWKHTMRPHIQALLDPIVINKVIETISTWHLPNLTLKSKAQVVKILAVDD